MTLVKLKLIDNPILKTMTLRLIVKTSDLFPIKPPKSKFIDVRKKSFTTPSGSKREKIFPKTPPKIAPTNNDITIICTLRLCKICFFRCK